jgi:two-component system, NarL family, invasion response regulator UvrY
MIKMLIIDDHAVVRRGVIQILEENLAMRTVFDEASNGKDALVKIDATGYDLISLDISLPDMNGLDLLKLLKREKPCVPVLLLSMHPEEQYAIRALKLGAAGYLTKQSAPDELVTAVSKILQGGKYVSSALSERLVTALGKTEHSGAVSHEMLSDREYRVFCLIASGNTIKQIAEQLFLSIKTVSTYRTRLLKKMAMKNNAEIITYAIKNGLVD